MPILRRGSGYHVPIWRSLAARADLATRVGYFSEQGAVPAFDAGFGRSVAWDQPLLEGYPHEFIARRPIAEADRFRIPDAGHWLSGNRPDVVFLHGYTHAFARQIIRYKAKFGYRVLLHGEFLDIPRSRSVFRRLLRHVYLKWFYGHVDHFLPIGIEAVEHLQGWGVAADRMTVAPYCVDDRFFEGQSASLDRSSCRRELGIGADQRVFLFSGKMIPRKNPLLLVEALRGLAGDPRVAVIFVGDGELKAAVEAQAKSFLGERALFPGFVNPRELGRYFKASDALVLPSTFETWGLVVNEAMHFGLPCIVSDRVGCHRDLVEDWGKQDLFSAPGVATICGPVWSASWGTLCRRRRWEPKPMSGSSATPSKPQPMPFTGPSGS
jgi:glycosyltransferase involved in cell wall biosynthesis